MIVVIKNPYIVIFLYQIWPILYQKYFKCFGKKKAAHAMVSNLKSTKFYANKYKVIIKTSIILLKL